MYERGREMKKLCMIVSALLVITVVASGYRNINRKIPPTKLISTEVGDKIEFQEDIYISVVSSELLSEQETQENMKDIGNVLLGVRYLKVELLLENQSKEEKEVIMTDLNMESLGMSNGISLEGTKVLSEDGTIRPKVEPMSEKEVTVVYEVLSNSITEREWTHIEDREIWLTFTQYPEKKMLQLECGGRNR